MESNLNNLYINIKKMDDIFNEALIVIDTNVLLMAYQWRDTTFNQVFEILDELSKEERLKIPAQVLKEFANKRPQTIRDLSNDIHIKILSKLDRGKAEHHSLDKVIPSLEFIHNKDKLLESEKEYNKALLSLKEAQNDYKKTLNELLENIKDYLDNDPITERFKDIFAISCLNALNIDEDWLKNELETRKKKGIPPGYRDKGHMGDMIIWSEILKLNDKDVVFITRDNKNDWVYKDNTGSIMGARRELVEEFYNTNGKTFKIMSPLKFIETYLKYKGESVKDEVRNDMEETGNVYNQFKNLSLEDLMMARIEKKLEFIGRMEEICSPKEYDSLINTYLYAKELLNSNLDKAKDLLDIVDNTLDNLLDDFLSSK